MRRPGSLRLYIADRGPHPPLLCDGLGRHAARQANVIALAALEAPPHVHVRHDAAHLVQDLPLQLQRDEVGEYDPRMEPHTAMNNAIRNVYCSWEKAPLCVEDAPKVLPRALDDRQGDVEGHVVHPHIQAEVQGGMSKDAATTGGTPRHPSGEPLQRRLIGSLVPKRDEEKLIHMQDIGSCN